MDDRSPPSQPRRGLLSGGYADGGDADIPPRAQPNTQPRRGLLSGGYADDAAVESDLPATPPPPAKSGGLLSRYAQSPEKQSGWSQLTGNVRRLGQSLFGNSAEKQEEPQPASRAPGHRDWRATDFATGDLDHWDQHGKAPFVQPHDPDAPPTSADLDDYDGGDFRDQYSNIHGTAPRRSVPYADDSREYPIRDDDSREYPERERDDRYNRQQSRYDSRADDDTGGYETGGYETGGYETGGYETGGYETGGYETGGYETWRLWLAAR